jgi:alpha-beta hydrolase superfamily lysophospholipase
MNLLYLHGLSSKPGGVKPTFLRRQGYVVVNPALPDDDFAASVRIALAALEQSWPAVIVGSSRGGAVAMSLDAGPTPTPLVLIAPAWRRWGTASALNAPAIILHSEHDTVIPFDDSLELVRRSGRADATLVPVGADHNMTDPPALEALLAAIASAARLRAT